ncbi:MAG: hypothetical protein ACLP7Q_12285 [Isosphaeraceae bacterium]
MGALFPHNTNPTDTPSRYPLSRTGGHSAGFEQRCELISQSEIQELRELKEQMRKVRACHDRAKAEIIDKLRRGVPVQQGSWNVRLITRNNRFLSAKSLLPLFGKAEVERLKNQVQPTISYSVEISETD